jgi:hypothetical protein
VKQPEPEPEPQPQPEKPGSGWGSGSAVALLFLALRVVLLFVRPPFFDELYSVWMAGEPLSSIVPHLLHDSGPPLYYSLARFTSVDALRWMSLAFAAIAFALLLKRRWYLAAALLAVFPPAAFYATEARAYALCGLFVALGVLLLDDDRPLPAAIAFVLAAYAHYYGVLFFPVLLMRWRTGASPVPTGGGARRPLALAAAIVLFLPGFALALHQPAEATAWNVFHPPWVLLGVVALIAVARRWRFAPAVLIPVGLALAISLAGRNIYFPMRFEAVLAVPLVLWASVSLERWRPAVRTAVVVVLMIGSGLMIAEEMRRPSDSRVRAAMFAERFGPIDVVASDYAYLFARTRLGPRVRAFPPEQGEHPGWYRPPSMEAALGAARSLPANGFVFIGDAFTPELAAVRQVRRVQLRFSDGPAVVLWVEPAGLTATVH